MKTLHGYYAETKQDEKKKEIKNFRLTYKHKSCEIYPRARQTCVKNSLEKARRPDKLPTENEVRQVKEYITSEIKHVVSDYSIKKYVWLRSLVVARLTLYNARRGEEAARLLRSEWEMAQTDAWLPQDQIEKVNDPAQKYLLGKYKLVYLKGKGKKYVPVLAPLDLIEAIHLLNNDRIEFGIREDNMFLFATKGKNSHCSGWHAVDQVCQKIGLKLTETKMRHWISSIYASLDMTPEDRKIFLDHIGHEGQINEENYQCPQGMRTVLVMGRMFSGIDDGKKQILEFINIFKSVSVYHLPEQEQYIKVRTKLFNERKTCREKIKNKMNEITGSSNC